MGGKGGATTREQTYPTRGSSENHRLKSAKTERGYVGLIRRDISSEKFWQQKVVHGSFFPIKKSTSSSFPESSWLSTERDVFLGVLWMDSLDA